MSEPKNILTPNDGNLPEEKLLAYLEGRLSAAEQREVEEWLADEGMESDAMDGLQALPAGEARRAAFKLNNELRKTLKTRKRKRRTLKSNYWTLIALCLIILLAVLAYIIINMAVRRP